MANIKSQIKRIKTNEKARLRNKDVRSALKTAVRQAREAQSGGDIEAATAAVRNAARKLDKAASKGVIHKNQAANRKSALTAALTKVGLEPIATSTASKKASTPSKASKTSKAAKKAPARGR